MEYSQRHADRATEVLDRLARMWHEDLSEADRESFALQGCAIVDEVSRRKSSTATVLMAGYVWGFMEAEPTVTDERCHCHLYIKNNVGWFECPVHGRVYPSESTVTDDTDVTDDGRDYG